MADRDTDSGREPSLELPSFGLRRKKKRAASEPEVAPATERPTSAGAAPGPRDREPTEVLEPTGTTTVATPPPEGEQPTGARRRPRGDRLPAVSGPVVAVAAGAVVGLLAVGLTFGALQACETVRGTSSCGGGPGFFLLLAVLVLLTYVGSWLLHAGGVRDPGSTSFLAVGLLAVVALLFLIDVLMSPWMALVIPLVAAATFALSHQVTTTIVEEE